MRIVDRKPYIEKEWFGVTLRIGAAHTTEHVRKEREVRDRYREETGKNKLDDVDLREINCRTAWRQHPGRQPVRPGKYIYPPNSTSTAIILANLSNSVKIALDTDRITSL